MSDHEAKSRSIKELKAKKHHENFSLLRVSVKEIVHREKMEPQYVILFGSYARGDFNGFSDVDLIVVDHIRIRPTGWHALYRNKDWRMMY